VPEPISTPPQPRTRITVLKQPNSKKTRVSKDLPGPGAGLWSFAARIGVAGLAGLVAAAALTWMQIAPATATALGNLRADEGARAHAAAFDARLLELRRQMAAVASAPLTLETVTSADPAALARTGAALTALLDFADRVELFPPGAAQLDLDSPVPISFAALEVINRAETQPFVGPEAIEGQRRAIYVAQPIMIEDKIGGVLFAAISPRYFPDAIAGFDPDSAQIRIEQSFDAGSAISVLSWGTSAPVAEARRIPLAAPQWTLVYQPAVRSLPAPFGLEVAILPLGAAAAALLLGLWFTFRQLASRLHHDTALVGQRVLARLTDTPADLSPFQLAAFAPLAGQLATGPTVASAQHAAGSTQRLDVDMDMDIDPTADAPMVADAGGAGSIADNPDAGFLQIESVPADDNFGIEISDRVSPVDLGLRLAPEIFRAYDIRGLTGRNLTDEVVYWIGRAFAGEAREQQQTRVAIGRDGRHSSLPLRDALVRGLTEGGIDVIDIGQVPTPLLYYATHKLDTGTGIMITGSHNPPAYNGLKMMLAGETLADGRIQALRQRILDNHLPEGAGSVELVDLRESYLERILQDVVVAQSLKVVIDCGNGVAGDFAPELIRRLDCEVIPLYCDVDGDFPNHHPDPAEPTNLADLITVVKAEQADIGIAFDGDGDRIGVVTASGTIIWPDKLLMLYAQDIVGRNPGADIIYDVKCSRHLNNVISELGGRPIMWKTGHAHMKAKLKETGALLAGEFSGHICFGERWYGFDDALYAAARLLEIIGAAGEPADALFAQFPQTFSTPELKISTTEQAKFEIIKRLEAVADFGDGSLTTLDGLRVDYADGWGLIRPSNTSPVLTLRFEADNAAALARIQTLFEAQLASLDPDLTFR